MNNSPEKQNDGLNNEAAQEPVLYERYDKNELVTNDIYFEVRDQEAKLNRDSVIEFRQRLESFLFSKRAVAVKFHPIRWRRFRDRFREEQGVDWRDAKYDTVFYPAFFLQDSRFTGEISFESLTDDEKIQIVVPKRVVSPNPFSQIFGMSDEESLAMEKRDREKLNSEEHFDNLTAERRQSILEKLIESLYEVNIKDNNDPYQWHRWSYDIYTFDTPCRISFTEERKDFEFFFAWKLALTDLYDIKLFLDWQLRNTFDGNAYNFKEFVSLLIMKYEKIINSEHIIKLSNDFISTTQDINTELSVSQAVRFKKAGRPPLEKIEIVKPKERGKGDKKTISEKEDAGKLFSYLAQLRFILTDDATSKDNMSKSIQGLTGFSAKQIEDSLLYEGIKPKNLKEARKIVENIKDLIIKYLEKDLGG
ncbi:hypothetical protein [Runella sp.]|uniref:hypothetical protein n=1 Tax=Runella sp. TaxID=1960881 RepID=UPI003D134A47